MGDKAQKLVLSALRPLIARATDRKSVDDVAERILKGLEGIGWRHKLTRPPCPKCSGEGWLWCHELDHYRVDPYGGTDDTRYGCDGEVCKAWRVVMNALDQVETLAGDPDTV